MKKFGIILLSLILILILLSLNCISAHEDNVTQNLTNDHVVELIGDSVNEINVTSDNFDDVFKGQTLKTQYNNYTVNIQDDITDKGIITIKAKNVKFEGNNHTFSNTAFYVNANNVTLNNFTLIETCNLEDNDGAAICIDADDVSILNININFTAPDDIVAYGIYSIGARWNTNNNLRIINSTILFTGNNKKMLVYNYGVYLEYSLNAVFANNTVITALPLRQVQYGGATTAVIENEYVLSVGVSHCDNLNFTNNQIYTTVNYRGYDAYPTLDGVFIADSKFVTVSDNIIYEEDYVTLEYLPNYLYALDVYRTDNLTVSNNYIHVETTGGDYAAGTAYPIQLTGPAEGVVINNNTIYSISNGPNIGIYSQNFNGDNYITIINNRINVTGWAGNHSWALVAGIEAQDTGDVIRNNMIEIHNTHATKDEDNLYGISYSQSTDTKHSFEVVNNTVFSDGKYFSHMLDATNTTVTNNTLVHLDKYGKTGYDPFKRGDAIGEDTDFIKNNYFDGNRVITIFEYVMEHQSDEIDGGYEFNYVVPTNIKNIANIINGIGINHNRPGFPGFNPLIPGTGGTIKTDDGESGISTPDAPDGDSDFAGFPNVDRDNGESLSKKYNGQDDGETEYYYNGITEHNSYSSNVKAYNSSQTTPSSTGSPSSGGGASASASGSLGGSGTSSSGGQMENQKAYEIEKSVTEDDPYFMLKFIAIAIICELLLVTGYKRKEGTENNE